MDEILKFINRKIRDTNERIEIELDNAKNDRGYASENIIKNLRDFVEYIIFKVYVIEKIKNYIEYNHYNNSQAISYIKSIAKHKILKNFHSLLEIGPSHNSYNKDGSTRLMIKYQEYLIELKSYYYKNFGEEILKNLYKFPIYCIEPELIEYYRDIYNIMEEYDYSESKSLLKEPYYIIKEKPIAFNDKLFYELTLTPAVDYINKYNRTIFYSPVKISSNYAIKISYIKKEIGFLDDKISINIITNYKIFIKSAEINSLYKIFGIKKRVSSNSNEFEYVMNYLKKNEYSLNDIVDFSDEEFNQLETNTSNFNTHNIVELLKLIRGIIRNNLPGKNILKYLIYRTRNSVISKQLSDNPCSILSNLYLKYGCNIFEVMPYASSLIDHIVFVNELIEIIEPYGRKHEFFYRSIKNICDNSNRIFVSFEELNKSEEECINLVKSFNQNVYYKHTDRMLKIISKYVYIYGYADSTNKIIKILKEKMNEKYEEYNSLYSMFEFLDEYKYTDMQKEVIAKKVFDSSKVALIYGSAGTGKTEMIKIISRVFGEKKIAFLSKTNSAVNNLKNRLKENMYCYKYVFSTIDSFVSNRENFDLIVIDECSMIENEKMLKILEQCNFECLLLVGDIYQIESIEFGNWFIFAKQLITNGVYELSENFRTSNHGLMKLWEKVRKIDKGITEKIIDEEYQSNINEKIFEKIDSDEIILCLNYDGPYGINSVNKYMQLKNPNVQIDWGINSYKIGDPIIFSDNNRFLNVLYNNLKGKIINILRNENEIIFQIFVEKHITKEEKFFCDFKIIEYIDDGTIIEFKVVSKENDEIEDSLEQVVPFVVSYASSIHKAQGLEYNSVKIIISNETDEQITKNIFYTAITRAKKHLKIFWSPESQEKILKNLSDNDLKIDINILNNKF